MIRPAKDGELVGTAASGQYKLVSEEGGKVTGCVACSVLHGVAWLHDIEYWGDDPSTPAQFMRKAFRWMQAQGHKEFLCNVSAKATNVKAMCEARGKLYQTVFLMEVPGNGS